MSTTPTAPVTTGSTPDGPGRPRRRYGIGRVLITVYAILAIGATSRAIYQMATVYSTARLAITLSALSGVIYVLATLALLLPGRTWYRIAWVTISFELAGVIIIGTLSILVPSIFVQGSGVDGTVWSYYGYGYLFIPLVLPILGMLWLRSRRGQPDLTAPAAGA
jgi:hypothetical protein